MDFSKINLEDNQPLARLIIKKACQRTFKDRREFEKFRNAIIKEAGGEIFHNLYFVKAYHDLINEGQIQENLAVLSLIQKRGVRTLSGVAPVTVLTKPFPCPGKCVYCPTDVRMPKSYIATQPAAQRGFRQKFDPYTQVFVRLKALMTTGHEVSKVELRVLGGTWSSYPKKYQTWFLKRCLQAMNEFYEQVADGKADDMSKLVKREVVKNFHRSDFINTVKIKSIKKNLRFDEVVKENEKAKVRCIGINIETRPDFIDEREVKRLRRLGVTKVEIGVQTTDDHVQELTRRGHDLKSVRDATMLLKDAGFKLSYHMMPNLPGSTIEMDKKMVGELFQDSGYQPDYLKLYPCMVIPGTPLAATFRRGEFQPYDDRTLEEVLYEELKSVPEYCRVDRIARDIPANEILAGSKQSNIRQVLEKRLIKEGIPPRDIRFREVKGESVNPKSVKLIVREYEASGGKELFLSFEDVENDRLVALLRLRFPGRTFIPELKNAAIVREVHVYGKQIAVGKKVSGEKQHIGWGMRLMQEAEKFAKNNGFEKIAVIAGIGTREYYKKLGYNLDGTYMIKLV